MSENQTPTKQKLPQGMLLSGVVRGHRVDEQNRRYLGFAFYTLDEYNEQQIHTEELRLSADVSETFLDSIRANKGKHCLLSVVREMADYQGNRYLRTSIPDDAQLIPLS